MSWTVFGKKIYEPRHDKTGLNDKIFDFEIFTDSECIVFSGYNGIFILKIGRKMTK